MNEQVEIRMVPVGTWFMTSRKIWYKKQLNNGNKPDKCYGTQIGSLHKYEFDKNMKVEIRR